MNPQVADLEHVGAMAPEQWIALWKSLIVRVVGQTHPTTKLVFDTERIVNDLTVGLNDASRPTWVIPVITPANLLSAYDPASPTACASTAVGQFAQDCWVWIAKNAPDTQVAVTLQGLKTPVDWLRSCEATGSVAWTRYSWGQGARDALINLPPARWRVRPELARPFNSARSTSLAERMLLQLLHEECVSQKLVSAYALDYFSTTGCFIAADVLIDDSQRRSYMDLPTVWVSHSPSGARVINITSLNRRRFTYGGPLRMSADARSVVRVEGTRMMWDLLPDDPSDYGLAVDPDDAPPAGDIGRLVTGGHPHSTEGAGSDE